MKIERLKNKHLAHNTRSYAHWLADVHFGSFAPANETYRKTVPSMPIARSLAVILKK